MEGDILNCSLTFTGEQVRKNFFQPIRGLKIFSDTPILLHQIINSQQVKKSFKIWDNRVCDSRLIHWGFVFLLGDKEQTRKQATKE